MHHSRSVTLQQSVRFFAGMLFWLPLVVFSLLLVYNTLPYFSFSKKFLFIEERAFLFTNSLYNTSFYIHIFAGMFCILAALVQFSRYVLKKAKKIHVWSGRIYVFVVLILGAPTGLYMSFFAKGSVWERTLFMFMALFWFYTTLKGLTTILKKNVLAHKIWMIRSYAMALTAVTFRVYHLVFYLLGWDHLANYELSLWLSVIGNMLLAELFIFRKSSAYLKLRHSFTHL
jgi:Predicted membrane protein (DUF2306)